MAEYNVVVALRPSTGPGGGLADATLTVLPRIDTNPPPCSTRTCSGFRRAAYIREVPGVVKFKGVRCVSVRGPRAPTETRDVLEYNGRLR